MRRRPPARCRRAHVLAAFALAVALGLGTATASAQVPPPGAEGPTAPAALTWGVRPSSPTGPDGRDVFTYDLAPGGYVDDWVGVSNLTLQPLAIAVYASDAVTTGEGGFDLLPADQPPVDVGAWVEVAQREVVVPPRSRLEVPFRLRVPADATPGDHVGGVVAALTLAEEVDGERVRVDRRVGARIYLRVDGPIAPGLEVTDVDLDYEGSAAPWRAGDATIEYTIRNTGNVRLSGTPVVDVAGLLGLGAAEVTADPVDDLLPGGEIRRSTRVEGVLPLARLTATVALDATGTADGDAVAVAARGRATAWAPPWSQAAVLLVVVGGGLVERSRRARRRGGVEAALQAAREAGRAEERAAATGDPGRVLDLRDPVPASVDAEPAPAGERTAAEDGARST